ncbi:iron-sulfur protein [Spongiactinospora rosea]|uniref:Cytochrome bc1 complex Rieske iron-sulfur subunit n=1 Tax=Spongiactinospora rosea TaxID=2248750 RepID=A0A366LYJ5_9ACTN|nr:Rieske (2Fe-2S) protein [Spongiactinospora rosea]RBQ19038.1 iron-sulfur protein [Spongiactinospora rosea]
MSDLSAGPNAAQPQTAASDPTRRVLVVGAGGAGLVAVLAACSSYGDPGGTGGTDSATASTSSAPSAPSASATGESGGAGGFARTSDIPEGGGAIFKEQQIVVTQPTAGEYKAFSVACTHKGCAVEDVSGGTINCPCHGSKFKIADGSVAAGPATEPLPAKQIKVEGDAISLA